MTFKKGDIVYVDNVTSVYVDNVTSKGEVGYTGNFKVLRIIKHLNVHVLGLGAISPPLINFSISTTSKQFHKIKTLTEVRAMKINRIKEKIKHKQYG